MRRHQALGQNLRLDLCAAHALAGIERADALHQRFLEGASDGHHFAHRFHLRAQGVVGAGKFLELPLRNFHDDVVQRRLEAGWSLARDVVGNLVERVAHSQFRGDLRDRESGGLRRQCRRPRDARVHLDHHHAPGLGIHAELNIRSAGVDADLANHGNRRIAHGLVLAVGERLRRSNRDRIAGVHAHGIEVLNRADDDDVVFGVAHHLELEFLPAQHRLFNQRLAHGREIEAAAENLQHFFAVIGDAAARAAQRERWPDDHRETDLAGELDAIFRVVDQRRLGHVEPDALHRVFEEEAVFGLLDGGNVRADQERRCTFPARRHRKVRSQDSTRSVRRRSAARQNPRPATFPARCG